ncbi:MAG: hypothetical protein ACRYG4_07980, partial [Janthinobacterium lividum]
NLHEVEKLIGHKVPRHAATAAVPDEVQDAAETIAVPVDALPTDEAARDLDLADGSASPIENDDSARPPLDGDAPRPRRRRGGRGRKPEGQRTEQAGEARPVEPRAAEPRASEPRTAEPKAAEPRSSEPRAAEPARSAPREQPRQGREPRRDDKRRDEGRRDESRRDEGRRHSNDDGPSEIGFGNDVPAFMLVKARG